MVSQASITAKVSYGLGRAANALGAPCGWYRYPGGNNPHQSPIAAGAYRGPVTAAFQVPNTQFTTPSNYSKPLLWGFFNTTLVASGDYLIDPNIGMLFVASTDPMRYPLCVACNSVLTLTRPMPGAAGAAHYEGDTAADETLLGTGWPASVLNGTKGEKTSENLPGDTRAAWTAILLPASFPAQLVTGDIATTNDAKPRRHVLSACELTSLGWRLTGALATL